MRNLTQYPFEIRPLAQEEGGGYLVSFTTGELWQFLKLSDSLLQIDPEKIYIEHIDKILGMLAKMAAG